jgi:hypothetical protein
MPSVPVPKVVKAQQASLISECQNNSISLHSGGQAPLSPVFQTAHNLRHKAIIANSPHAQCAEIASAKKRAVAYWHYARILG